MAPRTTTSRPATGDRVSDARIEKTRLRSGPLRRLENGLLDVNRKAGKHLKAIRANSQTPLPRLPPELRNRIWNLALGGYIFDVDCRKVKGSSRRRFVVRSQTGSENLGAPTALLRVCCQVYAETALLPYKLNAYRFSSDAAFFSVSDLHPVQQALISEVHIATDSLGGICAPRYIPFEDLQSLDALRLDLFPGLARIVIGVYVPALHAKLLGYADSFLKDLVDNVTDGMADISSYIAAARPEVDVVFKRIFRFCF